MTDPRKAARTAAANATATAALIDGAYDAIRRRSTVADGYPTQTVGASPSSASGPRHTCDGTGSIDCDACWPVTLTATERAALAQERTDQAMRELETAATDAADATARLYALARRHNPPQDAVPRCTGGAGMEGAIEWGNPLCANVAAPDRAGLCYACDKRRQRANNNLRNSA